MNARRPLHALLVTSAAAGLLMSAALPSSAAGGGQRSYKTSAAIAGSIQDAIDGRLGSLTLEDHSTDADRILGDLARTDSLVIQNRVCKNSSLVIFGEAANWANMAVDSGAQKGRMRLDCTYANGTKHRFHWGMTTLTSGGAIDPGRTNCLVLHRLAGTATTSTYTVSAPADGTCKAQREVLNSDWTTSDRMTLDLPFDATFTVSGIVPVG
ncbi:MAG: hypothetical protein LC789_00135 [Actinobacteria bacterium]|nr:hypothetical protein [Actinomycetota bacterium]